ncbi:MAG TPA: autotransporter-associated beta strand repeat-containing protein, partial [Tepidisphaeraceae bacterium]
LDLNSQNQTIGSLAGVSGSAVKLGGGTLTTGGNNTSTTFGGVISGTGGLVKTGTGIMTLTGVNTYTGGTKVANATLVIGANGALAPGNVTIGDGNGTLQLATNTGGETISGLSILAGSSLDMTNNHLFIDYAAGEQASVDATIRGYLTNGYHSGAWNGTSGSATGGGINSSTAALPANSQFALGYADGADGVVTGLSSGQVEVKYTLYGDANLDGVVSGVDFTILVGNLGKSVNAWDKGDFNYDGVVSGTDFTALVGNLGKSASGADITLPASDLAAIDAFAAANGLLASVPEPTTASILAFGAVGLLARRRRKGTIA